MLRRDFLKALTASLVIYQHPFLAASNLPSKQPKVIWVMLRGALDSLHTVVPTFEVSLDTLRPTLFKSIKDNCLPLTQANEIQQKFALHPSFVNLHKWYQDKDLLPIVATSSGYDKRSHFEGQDYLESGLTTPDLDNGWLARCIKTKHKQALAISQSSPISLRGADELSKTWFPSTLPDAEHETYLALQQLYQHSPKLLARLEEGISMRDLLDKETMQKKQKGNFITLCRSCGKFLAQSNVDCAMLTLGGWDTHKNQNAQLQRQLSLLDKGLQTLKGELNEHWNDTLIIVATEFGRTVKENGTRGTDHGTAGALFLAGGKINGGQVLGHWPGLNPDQLHQQRDLKATSHHFDWIAAAIQQHWQLTETQVNTIFPTAKVYQGDIFRN